MSVVFYWKMSQQYNMDFVHAQPCPGYRVQLISTSVLSMDDVLIGFGRHLYSNHLACLENTSVCLFISESKDTDKLRHCQEQEPILIHGNIN